MPFTEDIPIDSIQVNERGRSELDGKGEQSLERLMHSMANLGQIQPILLAPGCILVAGGRRLEAAKRLGWPTIQAVFQGRLKDNPLLQKQLELEENLRRKDLEFTEQCKLTAEIDTLMRSVHGSAVDGPPVDGAADGWSQRDTAEMLERPVSSVNEDLKIARVMEECPELFDGCQSRAEVLRRLDARVEALTREKDRRFYAAIAIPTFIQSRALEYLRSLPDASIDLGIIDPPYGTDSDKRETFYKGGVHFDDSTETALATVKEVAGELRRVIKPEGHLYCFISELLADAVKGLLHDAGFRVDPVSLIWSKNTVGQVDWTRRYGPSYEPIVFCYSDRRLSQASKNVLTFNSLHGSLKANFAEKPVELLQFLIFQSTQPGESVLDCFAGSGSTLVAATLMGRLVFGCEPDPDQYLAAANWLRKATINYQRGVAEAPPQEDPPDATSPEMPSPGPDDNVQAGVEDCD